MITGWGSHHYDILHWALNTELSGPARVEGRAEFPTNKIWNVHGAYEVELTYRVPGMGNVLVSVSDKLPQRIEILWRGRLDLGNARRTDDFERSGHAR